MKERLAHYKIVRKLGEGGMGEVFFAEDTKLKRPVALKLIPHELRDREQVLQRFQIEAEAAAKLNHPNIATIFSVEEADGEQFITMEYIEGRPLNELVDGGLTLERFLEWFVPLADALAHAHEAGIVHRDIKPPNILVTSRGVPKILDFGLAHVTQPDVDAADEEAITRTPTKAGTILGTPAYMAPEQAEGKAVDSRSDVFSFGVVMYEALTGRRPFAGDSPAAMLSSLLRDQPAPLQELRPELPYTLVRLIGRCLQKDPRRRVQSMLDVRNELSEVKEEVASGVFVAVSASSPSLQGVPVAVRRGGMVGWKRGAAIAAVIVIAALLGGLAFRYWPRQPAAPARLLPITLDGFSAAWDGPEISPDGTRVAYTLTAEGPIWVRDLDALEPRSIAGTDGALRPFWSPDGTRIAYFDVLRNAIEVVPAAGGDVTKLADWQGGLVIDATWGANGRIVANYPVGNSTGLFDVPTTGGTPQIIHQPDFSGSETALFTPSFLPDGTLMYVVHHGIESEIVVDLAEGRKTLFEIPDARVAFPTYSESGHLLYQRGWPLSSGLWAVPFSLDRLEVTGEPFLVAQGGGWPSISKDGTLVYRHTTPGMEQLAWVDRAGRVVDSIGQPHGNILSPALSPDGSMIALAADEQGGNGNTPDVWVYDLETGSRTRITFDSDYDGQPAWYPGSDRVVFTTFRNFAFDFYDKAADGSGEDQPLLLVPPDVALDQRPTRFYPQISKDGKYLVYAVSFPGSDTNYDIWYLRLGVEGAEPVRFQETPDAEQAPELSPSGDLIAFYSNESGGNEVFVQRFPGGAGKWQISDDGGTHPRWNGAGDRLYYVHGDDIMEVEIETQPRFRSGVPHRLFSWKGLIQNDQGPRFAVAADGQRFVVVEPVVPPRTDMVIAPSWVDAFH